MADKKIAEFSFRFIFKEHISLEKKNKFWEDFIFVFIEENDWYCGGSYDGASIYDLNATTEYENLKNKTLDFLMDYTNSLQSIIITEFDERTDEFIDKAQIII